MAEVKMLSVEGGVEKPFLGETQDVNVKDILRFADGYPGVVYTKELKIKNQM